MFKLISMTHLFSIRKEIEYHLTLTVLYIHYFKCVICVYLHMLDIIKSRTSERKFLEPVRYLGTFVEIYGECEARTKAFSFFVVKLTFVC